MFAQLHKSATVESPKLILLRLNRQVEKKPASSGSADKRGRQDTHYFNSADFQLKISNEGHYASSPFTVDDLDLSKDFLINFQIKSIRNGGSTRYGIAWNYTPIRSVREEAEGTRRFHGYRKDL